VVSKVHLGDRLASMHTRLLLRGYSSAGSAFLFFFYEEFTTHSRRSLLSTCNQT